MAVMMGPQTARGSRSRFLLSLSIFLTLIPCGAIARAQVKVLRVDPQQTDPAIRAVHGPHVAVYDPQVASNHRLLVFFVGTGGRAERSTWIVSTYATWGYHAISLDYEDNVVAVTCAHSQDPKCFDHYREAIVLGAPGSGKIHVDRANSILNRLQKLLVYLAQHDPSGGWGQFVANGQPNWSRMVVAGHSQGSGHAAFLGKMYKVDRVLIFSGPQDYLDNLHEPAPWQSRPSATPPARFFAFLSKKDMFNIHHQIANCKVLMETSKPKMEHVKPGKGVHGHPQILINDWKIAKQAHGSTLRREYEKVWKYMATTPLG